MRSLFHYPLFIICHPLTLILLVSPHSHQVSIWNTPYLITHVSTYAGTLQLPATTSSRCKYPWFTNYPRSFINGYLDLPTIFTNTIKYPPITIYSLLHNPGTSTYPPYYWMPTHHQLLLRLYTYVLYLPVMDYLRHTFHYLSQFIHLSRNRSQRATPKPIHSAVW